MSDQFEDHSVRRRRKKRSDEGSDFDDNFVSVVIPSSKMEALLAYYSGLVGLIGCGTFFVGGVFEIKPTILGFFGATGFFGGVPLFLGILAVRKASSHPESIGIGHACIGITLGAIELLTGLVASAFLLYLVASGRA